MLVPVGHEVLSQNEDWRIRFTDSDPDETALNEVVGFCGPAKPAGSTGQLVS